MKAIADLIAYALTLLFNLFGDIDLSGLSAAVETITPYIKGALYILPGETIKDIFAVVVMLWAFRLTIKTVKTIWNLIPIA